MFTNLYKIDRKIGWKEHACSAFVDLHKFDRKIGKFGWNIYARAIIVILRSRPGFAQPRITTINIGASTVGKEIGQK